MEINPDDEISNGIKKAVNQQQVLARMQGKRNPLTLLVGM
jgi:hypothetical protein